MHTMQRNENKTWVVGRVEYENGKPMFLVLFDKISFANALRLVNCLNGGVNIVDASILKILEACAHG